MKPETLDELIDRVAAGMTEAASTTMHPRFTAESISRLQRRGGFPKLALVASGVALVTSATLWNWPENQGALPDRAALRARHLASVEPLRESVRPTSLPAMPRFARPETTMRRDTAPSPFATPATADGTPPLLVDELDVSPLSSPDIAQIPALEIAPLDVPDLPASVINKESLQ